MKFTRDELMTVTAARTLADGAVCFVGIGLPSKAANLARLTHAPNAVLIYESGPIGSKPSVLPLSIGDGELATSADTVVPTHEIFRYWLQGGRIDVGFLGAAQIDEHANVNTTVIGDYENPRVRLPGAGGAPEIATHAKEVVLVLKHSTRSMVESLDYVTSAGFLGGRNERSAAGIPGAGPKVVITDLGVMRPDASGHLVLTSIHPGVNVDDVQAATGWALRVADAVETTAAPNEHELTTLRELEARTAAAHTRKRGLP
ncbi:MAG: CoA-transferase subunit beta [Myxococcota bacterium]